MDLTTFRKILDLERDKGYQDCAVVGGLDRYLERWEGQLLDLLPPVSYASMDTAARQGWVGAALRWLNGSGAEPAAGTSLGAATRSRKAKAAPAPAKTRVAAEEQAADWSHKLDAPVASIKGVSDKLLPRFRRLGVETVRDMLYFFPRRHLDYSRQKSIAQLQVGEEQTVVVTLWQAKETIIGGRRSTEAGVGDESGNMRVVWFNQPYLARQLRPNSKLVLSGKVSMFKGVKVFQSPEYEPLAGEDLTHTGRLVPLYPLTSGLSSRVVRRLVKETVDTWAPRLHDFLPDDVLQQAQLLDLPRAIQQAHYPDDERSKDLARRRLAFDELFLIQLEVLSRRRGWREGVRANRIKPAAGVVQPFLGSLPYELTAAQRRALEEILADMGKTRPMTRLLQGEVGSGKTVVATAALLAAVDGGYQGAFMAPTEVLAEQHYPNICQLLAGAGSQPQSPGHMCTFDSLLARPVTLAILIGSMKPAEKRAVRRAIADGEVDIVIGTHALIQGEVDFKRLGLAVVDEQHRFGVMQRAALRQKGRNPHLLVMTATPIPRSLSLTLYGDLDLSVIDELPAGRQQIKTKWLEPDEREKAYRFLRKEVGEGRQAFIICPLVAESETIEARAAVSEHERLCGDVFPDLRLGLVHGRLKAAEKERVMRSFRQGELDILVATPVVEVGIDVPNATVMLIEGADRFGLAQLHQFRGRVGRGQHQSYCMLVAESPTCEGRERLSLLEQTQDGFVLAEQDLNLRGPGEFFGTRQSGLPDLKMARLSDMKLLELARNQAIRLFKGDPDLSLPQHGRLKGEMTRLREQGIKSGEAS